MPKAPRKVAFGSLTPHQDGLSLSTETQPTSAPVDQLDKLRFRDFLRSECGQESPGSSELTSLLQDMNLATDGGFLNLAGLLLFARCPELIAPRAIVNAVRFCDNIAYNESAADTKTFTGPLCEVFGDALTFIMRYLHKIQAGRGVNTPGLPEVPKNVFVELSVNALVHRDYSIDRPIRLSIFENRIEIISPGSLPSNLTVKKIKAGNSNIRNPILASCAARGLLPHHGLGSGINRALKDWPDIEFLNDRKGASFTAIIRRVDINRMR
jgi:ATP-dependent DNA helicase RecG